MGSQQDAKRHPHRLAGVEFDPAPPGWIVMLGGLLVAGFVGLCPEFVWRRIPDAWLSRVGLVKP
jgi:hypothetical protein